MAERGKWADKLMEAYTSYKDGYVDQSALKYLFLAELGYETAQTNFAYMLDRGIFLFLFNSWLNSQYGECRLRDSGAL